MISRIQSSCKNGMKFEDAMTQALGEILQNLQVINEDTKKPRCRKGSVPAIWYATVGGTEERITTFKQSNKVTERRFSEVTTSALSTMPALQSFEEENVNTEQVDIGLGCQDEVIQEDSADEQKEDEDIQLERLISAPVRTTLEATTSKQPKKEMERKMSVFTAPALSAMRSLQSLEEDEENLDKVGIGLGCQDKVIEEDSADKQKEDAAVRGTSETTTLKQPKKKMTFSALDSPALTAMSSLQSLKEEEVQIDKVDISLGYQDKVIHEVSAEKQREDVDIQSRRRRISAPAIGTSETTTLNLPKKEMTFSVLDSSALIAMPSLQSLEEEKVTIDVVDIGFGCQDKSIDEDLAEKQREDGNIQPRIRRISAPVIGTSETKSSKQTKKKMGRKFSLFAAPALSATPSLQSLDEDEVNINVVDIGLGCQDKGIEEDLAEKQREDRDIQPRIRRISAPVIGTSETKSSKQSKKKTRRKFSLFAAPALSASPSLQSMDEDEVTGFGCQDKVIEEGNAEKQREDVDTQPRRRRTSAPARGTSETKTPKQPKTKMRRKVSLFAAPANKESLESLDEENVNIDKVDIGFGYNDRTIERDTKKQPRRRRVSAPARTYRETAETITFKQIKKDLVRKMSRPTLLPDAALPTMPWLADCVEDQMDSNFEPVEFNLSFLDDLMKL